MNVMKKIYLFIIITLLIVSCDNSLDITPDGRMSLEDVFTNEIQTEAYLNTVYTSIPSYFNNYYNWSFLAGITDEAQDAEVGNNPQSMASSWITGSLTPSFNPIAQPGSWPPAGGQDRYTTFWAGIRDANVFLKYSSDVTFKDEDRKARIIAEAKLLRAFFYFELIKQFGAMPIITEPFDPAFDYTKLKRPTFQDCIDFIAKECTQIINEKKLPLRITLESERGRFTLAVAYAVKSEALLYNASPLWNSNNDIAKWTAAANASKEAIEALTTGDQYELYNNYEAYFLNSSDLTESPRDKETIFEIKTGTIPLSTTGIPSKEGSWKIGATPSQELVDSYDMQATGEPAILGYEDEDHLKPILNPASGYDERNPYVGRDPRFYATVWYNGALYDNINGKIHTVETFIGGADQLIKSPPNRINTHTGYYLRKFIDPKLTINQEPSSKFKKYRLAELYLNFAEAENEAEGPTPDVYAAINTVRKRANMPDLPVGLNQEQMRERIRRERRVEFAWEEHRFWDVRRWKILNQTDRLVTGMEITGGVGTSGKVNIPNSGFESEITGFWSLNPNTTVGNPPDHTSAHAVRMTDGGGVSGNVSGLEGGKTYKLTAEMNVESGEYIFLGVRDHGKPEEVTVISPGGGWKLHELEFTLPVGQTTATIFVWSNNGVLWVDNFTLTKIDDESTSTSIKYTRFVTERRNAWQDKFLIFPIPITDASIIPDFQSNQNPGW